jgi:hypothetical protein
MEPITYNKNLYLLILLLSLSILQIKIWLFFHNHSFGVCHAYIMIFICDNRIGSNTSNTRKKRKLKREIFFSLSLFLCHHFSFTHSFLLYFFLLFLVDESLKRKCIYKFKIKKIKQIFYFF